jgi:hypothetical protein
MRFDERTSVAAATTREPCQGAFRLIDGHPAAAVLGFDLPLCEDQVLGAKSFDRRFRLAGQPDDFA